MISICRKHDFYKNGILISNDRTADVTSTGLFTGSKRFSCKQERLLTFDTYVILYSEYANCQNGPAADVPLPDSPTGKYRMHEGAEEDS